jgi:hypothetical protein
MDTTQFDDETPITQSATEMFGAAEGAWLDEQISAWFVENDPDGYEYECTDSRRMMRKGDESMEHRYAATVSCCGCMELGFGPSPAGHTYLYGFNYGH